ncbi:MAG: Smr/MutS family protein [Bacteroidia bacterium]|nr:Smr/MutS family protein [Bacteroidia bacterium]
MVNSFKIGDKVTFKNEALNGVVIALLANELVQVEVDGLPMDVHQNELIKLASGAQKLDAFFGKKEAPQADETVLPVHFSVNEGLHIITAPAVVNQITTGPVGIYIDNNQPTKYVGALWLKSENTITNLFYGIMPAYTLLHCKELLRGDVSAKHRLVFQAFEVADVSEIKKPIEMQLPVALPTLAQSNPHLSGHYIFAQIQTVLQPALPLETFHIEKLKQAFQPKSTKAKTDVFEYSSMLEVDLHIEAILPDKQVAAAETLQIQLQHFRQALDNAIVQRRKSLTFIHGIGNGILKQKIIAELNDYKGIVHKPASIQKYGLGAIEVILK